jgi:hopanoid-associated phosphorylase
VRTGLLVVVGMATEARILGGEHRVIVGTAGLEAALGDNPAGVISFGLCGALDPALSAGDLVIADGVVTPAGRIATDGAWAARLAAALPAAARGDVAASGMMASSREEKAALRVGTGAGIVDMESHRVAQGAAWAAIPFAVVRAVSDAAADALPRCAQAGFREDGQTDIAAVLRALARRPWEFPALIRTARGAGKALKSLGKAAKVLAPPA